jgi:AcrR family transcriptional regulator
MNAKRTVEAPKQRRTQEQRSSTTRSKVIAAAIDCLYRLGYASTTTAAIASAAGVSRGALLHHFPSKDELLIAVSSEVLTNSLQGLSTKLLEIEDPKERLLALPELAWKGILTPDYMAWLEIWLGTRGDEQLRAQFGHAYDVVNKQAAKAMRAMATEAGVKDLARMEHLRMVLLAALRGLAIEGAIVGDVRGFNPAVAEMRAMVEHFIAAPEATEKPAGKASAKRGSMPAKRAKR